jgi:DNA-binding beta-propeller fold protein YncE
MVETKYSTHIYDLSIKRVDVPVDLSGGSIKVLAVNGDCFVQLNDKSQDPINLLHVANIKTEFTKFYISNNVQVGGYVAIVVGKHCEFELTTNIARDIHKPLLLPPQNIPTHLLGRVIDTPKIINVWNIENATLRHSFNTTPQDTNPTGLFFKPNGLKVYTIGSQNDNVNEYDLSTAWDISTATFKHFFDIHLQSLNPSDIFFSSDGVFMYVTDSASGDIFGYVLSTPWDVRTATYTANIMIIAGIPSGVTFDNTGHKMYISTIDTNLIAEYDLSEAWNIHTSLFKHSFDVGLHIPSPMSVSFSPDGLKFYVIGEGLPQRIVAYRLLEAWNVTTAIYIQSFDYSLIFQDPKGIFFKPDGSKMYVISGTTDNIYEFDL